MLPGTPDVATLSSVVLDALPTNAFSHSLAQERGLSDRPPPRARCRGGLGTPGASCRRLGCARRRPCPAAGRLAQVAAPARTQPTEAEAPCRVRRGTSPEYVRPFNCRAA